MSEITTVLDVAPGIEFGPEPAAASLAAVEPAARRPQVVSEAPARPPAELSIMRHSEDVGDLFGALAEAQGEFTEIERTLKAKIESKRTDAKYEYGYAPLDEVLQAVRPALSKHGLVVMQFPLTRHSSVAVRTLIGHKSGQWIYNELTAQCLSLDPQAVGSVITYLRRYGAMSLLGVAPSYDDDGAAGAAGNEAAAAPAPAKRRSDQPKAEPAAAPEPIAPVSPSPVGVIIDVHEHNGGALIKLDTGFRCGSREAELITGAKAAKGAKVRVELATRPSSDPAKYAPVLTEILPIAGGAS